MGSDVRVRCRHVDFAGGKAVPCTQAGRPFLLSVRWFRGPRIVRLCPPHEAGWRNSPAWDPLPDLPLEEPDAVVWEVMSA